MIKNNKIVVEILPPGNCQGSRDWWLEDIATKWYKFFCVGEGKGKKKAKGTLGILDASTTQL